MTKPKRIMSIILAVLIAATIFIVPISVSGTSKLKTISGITQTNADSNNVVVSFSPVKNAKRYEACIATSKNGKYKKTNLTDFKLPLVNTKKTSKIIKDLSANSTYWVKFKAKALSKGNSNKDSVWSKPYKVRTALDTVKKITLKNQFKPFFEYIGTDVSFSSVKGAKSYRFYYSTSKNGKYLKAGWISAKKGNKYFFRSISQCYDHNKTYYIRIKAMVNSSNTECIFDSALSAAKKLPQLP